MLTLEQISQQYPESLRPYQRALLREYLQYKILEIIFSWEHAAKLSFLGGTALRILYGNTRFSEDLDFDNFGVNPEEFSSLAHGVQQGLEREGYRVEMNLAGKEAYRCNVRFLDILYDNSLSEHQNEKILLQIDSAAHAIVYQPERKILNKFDVFTEIYATPLDLLLSQKMYAAMNRKRAKGRDFYDIVFLLTLTKPNYAYLREKIGVNDAIELRTRLVDYCSRLDFNDLAVDVRPFLFTPADARRVQAFPTFIAQAPLS